MKNFFFAEQRLIGFADGQNPETTVQKRQEVADKKIESADGENKDKSKEINDKVAALTKKIEKMKSMSDTLPVERAKEWESFINKRIDEINANIDGNYEETEKAIQKCSEALDTAVIHGSSVIDVVREGDHATVKIPDVQGQQICISVDGHAPQYSVTRAGMHEFTVPCAKEDATATVTYTDLRTQEVTKVPLTIGRSGSINTKEIRKAEPKPKSAAPLDYGEFDQKIVEEPKKVEQSEYEKNAVAMQPTEHAPDAGVIKETQKEPMVEQSAYEEAVSDLKPTEREYEAQPSGYEQEMTKMTPKIPYEEPMEDIPTTKDQPSAAPMQSEEQKKAPAPMPDVADIENNVPPVGIPPLPTRPDTASKVIPKTNEPKAATFERPSPAAPASLTPEAKKEVPPVGIPPLPEKDKKKMPRRGNEEIRRKIREEADVDSKKTSPEVKKEVTKKVDQAKEALKKEPTTVREQHEQNMEKAMKKLEKAETKGEKWEAALEALMIAIQYIVDLIDGKLDKPIDGKKNTAKESPAEQEKTKRRRELSREINERKPIGGNPTMKVEEMKRERQDEMKANKTQITTLDTGIAQCKDTDQKLQKQKDSLQGKLKEAGADSASIQKEIDALTLAQNNNTASLKQLDEKRSALLARNSGLEADLSILQEIGEGLKKFSEMLHKVWDIMGMKVDATVQVPAEGIVLIVLKGAFTPEQKKALEALGGKENSDGSITINIAETPIKKESTASVIREDAMTSPEDAESQAFKARMKDIIYEKLDLPKGKNIAGESLLLSGISFIPKGDHLQKVIFSKGTYENGAKTFHGTYRYKAVNDIRKVLESKLSLAHEGKNQKVEFLKENEINEIFDALKQIPKAKEEPQVTTDYYPLGSY